MFKLIAITSILALAACSNDSNGLTEPKCNFFRIVNVVENGKTVSKSIPSCQASGDIVL